MNIKEIKEMILNETYTSQSELHDQILAYLNDRILTFCIKVNHRENPMILKTRYRARLIGLLNPTLQEKTRHEIFFCDEHTELEIVDADDIISTSCGDSR
jgi:hypothetical protein